MAGAAPPPRRLRAPGEGRAIAPDLIDRRLSGNVGLLCLAYYLLILGGHHYSLDGMVLFQTAKALVFQHRLTPEPPVIWQGMPQVGYWAIGMAVAYVPLLLVWLPLFMWAPRLIPTPYDPTLAMNPALYANVPYLLVSVLNPVLTAATAALVVAVARRLGLDRPWAVAAGLACGLASPVVAYARYDFSQPLVTLALTAAVWGVLRADATGDWRGLATAGASMAYAVFTRSEFLVLVPWLGGWVLVRSHRAGGIGAMARAALVGLPPGLAMAVNVWVDRLKHGARSWPEFRAAVFPDAPSDVLVALAGHLVSPGRGLLLFFPLAWLALPGLWRLARMRTPAAVLLSGLVLGVLAVYSGFRGWWAGLSWGPRYLVPVVPLLTLAATVWAASAVGEGRRGARAIFAGLAALGALVSWNAILVDVNDYYGWASGALGFPIDASAAQFRPRASPLVSGWFLAGGAPLDLFWIRLWNPATMPMLREALDGARARLGLDLGRYGWIAGLGAALLLLAALVAAARRIRALLTVATPSRGPV